MISIIVPVRNEERFIGPLLRQLLEQDYPRDRFEVIVADGQSSDRTADIVRQTQEQYGNLKLIESPRRLSSAGRNLGVAAAQGEIIVIVDGHCEIGTMDYLREVADVMMTSGADCIGRPQPLDIRDASPLQEAIALARSSILGHQPESHIYSTVERFVKAESVAVAYRRTVFDRIGNFDEGFDACEDVEFNHRIDRMGLRCYFSPRLALRYHPRGTLAGLFHQMARYGRGRVRLVRKHPDSFRFACFLPAFFVVGVVLGPSFVWASPWLLWAYISALALYGFGVLGVSVWIASVRPRLLAWLPPVFIAIHFGAGAGILSEWLSGLWRRRDAGFCNHPA
jgi:succinoglycan biosynthesis protein ExoA